MIAVMLVGLLPACGQQQEERSLMVSILPQKYLLDSIVGGHFRVECMLAKGGSPESYDPTMNQMMQLERCDAYFLIGNMSFENVLENRLQESGSDVRLVKSFEGIELLRGTCHHHHHEEAIDPHVWVSVSNLRTMARTMWQAVVGLDEEHAAEYEANYRRLDARLARLQDSLSVRLQPLRGRAFVVWHPALSYFARDYGLEQVSIEFDGKETPVRFVEERLAHARSRGATVFLIQSGADPRQAETVSRQMQVRVAEINPLGYNIEKELKTIADELLRENN